jgi:predicted transcriptional regulator
MEQKCLKQGDLHKEELVALDLEIRKEIIDFIGSELKMMKEIEDRLGLGFEELEDHLSILQRALLVEEAEEGFRLTPRCVAYYYETMGYEWRR